LIDAAYLAASGNDPKDKRFVRKGAFDPESWKVWVEESAWRPLRDLERRQCAIEARFLGARAPGAAVEARFLVASLVRLVAEDSKDLFARAKLDLPGSLRAPRDLTTR